MLDAMQKYVRAGLDALSSQGVQASSRLSPRIDNVTDQLSSVASALTDWWQEAGGTLVREVRDNVVKQVEAFGLATKKDVETLRARLDRLEARATSPTRVAGGGTSTSRATTAVRPSPSRSRSPRSASGRTPSPRRGREAPGQP